MTKKKDIEEIAKLLGAKIVGELPDVGGGALAAMQHAEFYRRRMQEVRAQTAQANPPQEESVPKSLELGVDNATYQALQFLAEAMSGPTHAISPHQLATGLIKGVAVVLIDQLIKALEGEQNARGTQIQRLEAALRVKRAILDELTGVARPAAG